MTGQISPGSPQHREPANELTQICPGHEREMRLRELRRCASARTRALGYALTVLIHRQADREAGA